MEALIIDKDNSKYINKNVFNFIKSKYPQLTSGNLNKLFRLKDVKVNGKWVNKDYLLCLNDKVAVYASEQILHCTSDTQKSIYEDENILVVYKPEKMECCNTTHKYQSNDIFLEHIVQETICQKASICHRLDTNTKGLVIFAKNSVASHELLLAFKNGLINKYYLAIVYGSPKESHKILVGYLTRDYKTNYSMVSNKKTTGSVLIKTEYTVLHKVCNNEVSILEVKLHTGKTHQIRAHLKSIGLYILGDSKYSTNEINRRFKLKSQALYAYKYNFNFKESSPLSYLNSVKIELDKDKIIKNLNLF